MNLSHGDNHLWLIGDPHFGRNFTTGMPLHRRGDREAMQRQLFIHELEYREANTIVMVGDLFDKPFIPFPILTQVVQDVKTAAMFRDDVDFIFMAGNHDRSRQLDQLGAWDVFQMATSWIDNVHVLNEPAIINGIAYFPWQWDVSAVDQVRNLDQKDAYKVAVGHWDLKDFGGDASHVCPVAEFNNDVELYSGHYHEEGDYEVSGVTIHCTGSLQPYAHGEGDMYVTLTLAEALAQDPADLYDKCVRVALAPGEVTPDIDCLQLTTIRIDDGGEITEIDLDAIGAQAFNLNATLAGEFAEHDVPDPVQDFIKENLSAAD